MSKLLIQAMICFHKYVKQRNPFLMLFKTLPKVQQKSPVPVPRERSAISMCFPAPGNYPPRALAEIVHRSEGTTCLEETTLLTVVSAVITCSHKLSNTALTYAIAACYPSQPAKRLDHTYNTSFHERFKAIFRQAVTPAHLHLVHYLPLIYWDVLRLGFQVKLPLK